MRSLAVLALCTGCSFLTARSANNPTEGCSRASGYGDLVVMGVAGVIATALAVRVTVKDDECSPLVRDCSFDVGDKTMIGITAFVGFVELIQSVYGFSIASSCEEERRNRAMPVVESSSSTAGGASS